MEAQLPKYNLIIRINRPDHNEMLDDYLDRINEQAELGYRIHTFDLDHTLLSLKSSPNIQDAEDFVNVPIGEERMAYLLEEGWIAIANYSKHVTLMRKKDGGASEGTAE